MLYFGDCFEILPTREKKDLGLVDLPIGETDNKWNVRIDFNKCGLS